MKTIIKETDKQRKQRIENEWQEFMKEVRKQNFEWNAQKKRLVS